MTRGINQKVNVVRETIGKVQLSKLSWPTPLNLFYFIILNSLVALFTLLKLAKGLHYFVYYNFYVN